MKLNLGIKAGIALPLLATLVIGMGILAVFNYTSQISVINSEAEETIKGTLNTAQGIIDGHLNLYQQMASLVVSMPTVSESLSKGDRSKLIAEFLPGYESLKTRIRLNQFNFHRPPGIAILRLQDLERYGDNLAAIRRTIYDVNEKKIGVKGLEFGRTGLGLRGVEPVFSKGAFVGSMEFGGDLAPAIEETKKAFGVEVGVVISKEATTVAQILPEWQKSAKPIGDYLLFYATKPDLSLGILTADIIAKAKKAAGQIYIDQAGYEGKDYFLGISSLKDYSGTEIGYIFILRDRTALLGKIKKAQAINVAIYFAILIAVAAAIVLGMTKNVVNPVIALTKAADDVSMGKLSEKIEVSGAKGEIATLAKSIDRMRVSMKKLLE